MRVSTSVPAVAAGPQAAAATGALPADGFGALLSALIPQAGGPHLPAAPSENPPVGATPEDPDRAANDTRLEPTVDTAEATTQAPMDGPIEGPTERLADAPDDDSGVATAGPAVPPTVPPVGWPLVTALMPPPIQPVPSADTPLATTPSVAGAGETAAETVQPASPHVAGAATAGQPPEPGVSTTDESTTEPAGSAGPPEIGMTVDRAGRSRPGDTDLGEGATDRRGDDRADARPGQRPEPGAGHRVTVSYQAPDLSAPTAPSAAPTTTLPPTPTPAVSAAQSTAPVVQAPLISSPTGPVAPSSMAHQVYDRIDRLASSGNGTHRVTMRLDPGTLGEVRILLTVQGGQVKVRLAAGDDARSALSHAAPDLQRLLQTHGAGEVRVDVTDLSHQGAPWSDQQPRQQADPQQGRPHDLSQTPMGSEDAGSRTGQHDAPARTHGAHTATEGDKDRVDRPGSVEPRRFAPVTGVDVHM